MKNIFLLLILFIFPAKSMEVTFFNIGQGNCTLVTVPGQKTMLVDAGSSSAPLEDAKCTQAIDELVAKIIAHSPNKQLLVVVSHADKDHINKISDICKRLLLKKFKLSLLLGGSKKNYTDTAIGTKLLSFIAANSKACSLRFAADIKGSDNQRFQQFKAIVPSYCTVLSALINQNDGNNNSLVLKVSDKKLSALLPGDATGDATDQIIDDKARKSLIKSDVFEVSHHGSGTHHCTNSRLLSAVNPKNIFISSGLYKGYNHPRYEVIKTLVEYCIPKKLTDAPQHLLSYYRPQAVHPFKEKTDETRFNLIAINDNDYCTAQTSFPIYNTLDSGTITYNQNGVTVNNTHSINEERSIGALKGIHTPLFNNIRFLFFNNMGIESSEIIKHLTVLPKALEYMDLRNNLIGNSGLEHLISLCNNHGNKLVIKLGDNRLIVKSRLAAALNQTTLKAIALKNRMLLTFSKKGQEKDTIESLEVSPGHNKRAPLQHAQAKAYAQDNSPDSPEATSNKVEHIIIETKKKKKIEKQVVFDLTHDKTKLYIERSDNDQKGYHYKWPGIVDICLLSDKTQTVAGITTKERSTLSDFENDKDKELDGIFRYTNPNKPWKTIGKEFWTLDEPGVSYYHERTPFSKNGEFVMAVSPKGKRINIYKTDPLVFDPRHVKLHKSISEEDLKNDLGHSIADIKRVEFIDYDNSIKFHFENKTHGELRYIL